MILINRYLFYPGKIKLYICNLFSFLAPEGYSIYLVSSNITCIKNYSISSDRVEDLETCTGLCDDDDECNFFFIHDNSGCKLYTRCDQTREAKYIGTTFKKDSGMIFTLSNSFLLIW